MRLPLLVFSALLATHSVRRSHDGTTCCGLSPTLNLSTTVNVAGSITYTSFDWMCGTYTHARSLATAGLILPAPVSLYRLVASVTGGIPGTVATGCASATNEVISSEDRTTDFTNAPTKLAMRHGGANGGDGLRDDGIYTFSAERRARAARVAGDAGTGRQAVAAHEPRIHRERERGVGKPRVHADLLGGIALALERVRESRGRRAIVVGNRVRTHR